MVKCIYSLIFFTFSANNYAIDTAGIGEALKRSASSFSAAHTDINEALAVVTTANSVVLMCHAA